MPGGAAAAPWILLVCALACGGCDERRCDEATRRRDWKAALEACTRAYERVGGGRLAARVAGAHVSLRDDDEAFRWASLPEAREQPEARRVRASVLRNRRKYAEARAGFQEALDAARAAGDSLEIALSAHQLAGVLFFEGRYSAALDLLELSAREAVRADYRPSQALVALGRGDLFNRLGDAERALEDYARAAELAAPYPSDLAYVELKRGQLHLERGALPLARMHLRRALELAEPRGILTVTDAAHFQLARTAAAAGDGAEAERHLSALTEPSRAAARSHEIRARLALQAKDAEAAVRHAEAAVAAATDEEQRLFSLTALGDALAGAGRGEASRAAYADAIAVVERLGALQPEFQAWVVARGRRPFDALFALHVEAGEHARALEVVARYAAWESLTFEPAPALDGAGLARGAEKVAGSWPLLGASDRRDLPDLAGREVLALHEAGGHLWAGVRRDGSVAFADAGASEAVDPLVTRFLADASDGAAADALGGALWRAGGLSARDEPLFLLATGRLRRIAFAALRHDGRYWTELRPLASLPALTARKEPPPAFDAGRWAIADPAGDLPAARDEAAWVASRVGAEQRVGEAATRQALFSARGAALLHLATHTRPSMEGTELLLADGEVSASDVLQRAPAARLVVLATCASATGRHVAGSDSLAAAFLRTGSLAVLATLRSVPDAAAQEFVRAFYEERGTTDPIRAAATAQRRLFASHPPSVWSAFSMSVAPLYSTAVTPR